jgi:diguanylate cyclase (GGDEF)-like protein
MDLPALDRESHGSPFARQLKDGFPNLRFQGLLEKEFREAYVEQNLPRGRLSGLVALILVLAVTCIDLVLGEGSVGEEINALRLGVLCPLLVVIVLATYHPSAKRFYMPLVSIGVTLVGLVATYICQTAALAGASYLLSGVVLVVLYACLFLGLLFNIAIVIASVLVAAHVVVGLNLGLDLNHLFYTGAILATAGVIGAISAYELEHALRTNFLETRLLNELAERDGLTGLYNRRIFDDLIPRIWRQARREEEALEVIFVDIDKFKVYNDLCGHQAGDDCLKTVAQCVARAAKRPFDFCARYGGDEFVLVLYGPPRDYARTLPEQIRRDVLALAIHHEGSEVGNVVTVSVGVALARPGSGRSLAGAIQTADEALYEAKQAGRNRVIFKDAEECEVETGNFRVVYRESG